MNWKKQIPLILKIVAVVSLIGAILLFALAVPKSDAAYKTVLEVILGILMLVLSALIGIYFFILRDVEPNFFLFDRARKRNVSVDDLTFQMVNERMTFFLGLVSQSTEELWTGNALETDSKLGYRRVYRPLLAYKMLYDLAEKDVSSYWDLLFNASPEIIASLCGALEQGGEQQLVTAFRCIMESYRDNPAKVKDFVNGNIKYLRNRMMSYVKKNIELFY